MAMPDNLVQNSQKKIPLRRVFRFLNLDFLFPNKSSTPLTYILYPTLMPDSQR